MISTCSIQKVSERKIGLKEDVLVTEEPMEIQVEIGDSNNRVKHSLAITMRTPGNDFELSLGFLFSEGIIKSLSDVENVQYCSKDKHQNIVIIRLSSIVKVDISSLTRHFYSSSSCGVCGKATLESLENKQLQTIPSTSKILSHDIIKAVELMNNTQVAFKHTGGIHSAALFNQEGKLIALREDVGRHNALDKLIGWALAKDIIPLQNHFILVSGRVGFEIAQKSVACGIELLGAIGAPSNLSVDIAERFGLSMVGFIKQSGFNIYHDKNRIIINN